MKIGFSGTRSGMTEQQWQRVADVVLTLNMTEAHEGDCVGADAQFWEIASAMLPPEQIVIHPPVKDECRAFKFVDGNIMREPKTYFARNRAIVDETEILIAAPVTMGETEGGTWYTINHARKMKKPVVICWPDGTHTREGYFTGGIVEHRTEYHKIIPPNKPLLALLFFWNLAISAVVAWMIWRLFW